MVVSDEQNNTDTTVSNLSTAKEDDEEQVDSSDDKIADQVERGLWRVETPPPHGEQLETFLQQAEDYIPTCPDAVTLRYIQRAGMPDADPCIVRIISVAAQRFISDVANDALQHCKTRTNNTQHSSAHGSNKDKKPNKDRKYQLTVEDLAPALADHGITVRKPQYFV